MEHYVCIDAFFLKANLVKNKNAMQTLSLHGILFKI